jgi:fucose 4-O-acetylase-like acetyltransferase
MKADKIHIYRFDNIKVFLMILVIIAHTLINSYGDKGMEYIRFFCLCYTMPLFTFISGYLSKREQHFKKNIIYLLLPCFVFTVINDLVEELVNPNYVFNWRQPGFAMWYLWVLFVFRVVLPYLIRVKYILLLSFNL